MILPPLGRKKIIVPALNIVPNLACIWLETATEPDGLLFPAYRLFPVCLPHQVCRRYQDARPRLAVRPEACLPADDLPGRVFRRHLASVSSFQACHLRVSGDPNNCFAPAHIRVIPRQHQCLPCRIRHTLSSLLGKIQVLLNLRLARSLPSKAGRPALHSCQACGREETFWPEEPGAEMPPCSESKDAAD